MTYERIAAVRRDMRRRIGWRGAVNYSLGFCAFHIWRMLPLWSGFNFLLPRSGDYIYWEDSLKIYHLR
jgi:hypothetical protein